MTSDPLATYVQDHLAGANGAIEIIQDLSADHCGEPLGDFAEGLLFALERDRETLQTIAGQVGGGYSRPKEAAAWAGSKLTRLKLGRSLAGDLGVFLALEALSLGILGKLALWRALEVVASNDIRLHGIDFDGLCDRAKTQHARVEERRLAAAHSVMPAPSQ